MQEEPLLRVNPSRFVLFPIHYEAAWELYKGTLAAFWTVEQIDLETDMTSWTGKLDARERQFLTQVVIRLALHNNIVGTNPVSRFLTEVEIPEVRCFFGYQMANENVHAEAYALLVERFVSGDVRESLFRSFSSTPSLQKSWSDKYFAATSSFATRLVAFAALKVVTFSAYFCSLARLEERGLTPGLCLIAEFATQDSACCVELVCLLYMMVVHRLPEKYTHNIIRECVNAEIPLIHECSVVGLEAEEMLQYVEFVADQLLQKLGYCVLYGVVNPFVWRKLRPAGRRSLKRSSGLANDHDEFCTTADF